MRRNFLRLPFGPPRRVAGWRAGPRAVLVATLLSPAIVASGLVAPAARAADAAFLSGVEDVPLMPGLAEVAGAATVFDAPQGRIVETFATGPVSAEEIRSFYGQTLPQLGWSAASASEIRALEFRREGETLILEITPDAAATTVRFTLAPQ